MKKSKFRNHPGFYYDPCFRQNFYFFIGWSEDKFNNYMEKNFQSKLENISAVDGATGMIEDDEKDVILIWTRFKPKSPKEIGILAHECLHAVGMTFEKVGVRYYQDNDEPFTYLLGRLVEEAMS